MILDATVIITCPWILGQIDGCLGGHDSSPEENKPSILQNVRFICQEELWQKIVPALTMRVNPVTDRALDFRIVIYLTSPPEMRILQLMVGALSANPRIENEDRIWKRGNLSTTKTAICG